MHHPENAQAKELLSGPEDERVIEMNRQAAPLPCRAKASKNKMPLIPVFLFPGRGRVILLL